MNEFEAWQKVIEEWKEVNRMKRLNQELYDLLGGAITHLLHYSEKNGIVLPNRDSIDRAIERIHQLMDDIEAPTNLNNQKKQPDNEQYQYLAFNTNTR